MNPTPPDLVSVTVPKAAALPWADYEWDCPQCGLRPVRVENADAEQVTLLMRCDQCDRLMETMRAITRPIFWRGYRTIPTFGEDHED